MRTKWHRRVRKAESACHAAVAKPVTAGVSLCHLVLAKTPHALRLVVFLEQGMKRYAMEQEIRHGASKGSSARAGDRQQFSLTHMNISSVCRQR